MFVAADAAGSGGRRLRRTDADGRVGRRAGGLRGGVRSRCQTDAEGGTDRRPMVAKNHKRKRGGMEGKLSSEY